GALHARAAPADAVLQGQGLRCLWRQRLPRAAGALRGHGDESGAAPPDHARRQHGRVARAGAEGRDAHAAHGRPAQGNARHHDAGRGHQGDRGHMIQNVMAEERPATGQDGQTLTVNLRALLEEMIRVGASDLHITAGERPKLRVDGEIVNAVTNPVLTPKDTLNLAYSILTENQKKRFETEDELDFSFGIQNLARFRGNVYRQRGCVSLAIRQIPFHVKTLAELKMPPQLERLAEKPRGLVLVTGPTGSGKSTTLAAMIDKIN